MQSANVLNVLLSHHEARLCERVVQRAVLVAADGNLLLAHGGKKQDFAPIAFTPKIFVADERLRTRDHQREFQSYTGIFQTVSDWMKSQAFEFVHFFEYDHLPLVADLNARQLCRLREEKADVLGFHLARIDGTNHPHFLRQAAFPEFGRLLTSVSRREDHDVILSMFVTGSFWTREAFEEVARIREPCPVYFEVYLPTVAHHLGFRLRDYGEQDRFVSPSGDWSRKIDKAKREGAWTLHPVKKLV